MEQLKRTQLLRQARGQRLYLTDVLSGLVAACALVSSLLSESHAELAAVSVPLALLAGYATRTTRQLTALGTLVEKLGTESRPVSGV